ncbi:hypothetical protein ACZ90_69650 [Streptomyces albus subsp. albus]|nr:hypothetical protein ACZ90_69650 [Streptomyces albus subsp. albus]
MLRRQFIIDLSGSLLLSLPSLPQRGRLGMADVDRIEASAARLHQIDDQHGAGQLSDVAARYITYVESVARLCTYGSRVQKRLYVVLAGLSTSAGWFAFDSNQQGKARSHWDAGLRYALLARDNLLQARIWSSMSHQAFRSGYGGEAVSIARAALDQTRGRRDGQLSALLHTRVANGLALQGESGWCARSLLRAEQSFDRQAGGEPQRWMGFFNVGEVAASTALCHLDLHQYDKAVDAAREALGIVQSTTFRRNQLACQVRLGRSLAAAGDLEEAMAAGESALALLPEVRSPRIGVGVEELRNELLRRGAPGAAEFSDRYDEAVA